MYYLLPDKETLTLDIANILAKYPTSNDKKGRAAMSSKQQISKYTYLLLF